MIILLYIYFDSKFVATNQKIKYKFVSITLKQLKKDYKEYNDI